jgi:hypothetical protein
MLQHSFPFRSRGSACDVRSIDRADCVLEKGHIFGGRWRSLQGWVRWHVVSAHILCIFPVLKTHQAFF